MVKHKETKKLKNMKKAVDFLKILSIIAKRAKYHNETF